MEQVFKDLQEKGLQKADPISLGDSGGSPDDKLQFSKPQEPEEQEWEMIDATERRDSVWSVVNVEAAQPPTPKVKDVTLLDVKNRMKSDSPYDRSIQCLRELNFPEESKTPFQKLCIISQVSSIIKKEIKAFWQGVNIKPDKLALDGDQIIMLYVYICSRANLHNILAHVQFCKEFSTPFMKTTRMGYCLTTLEVAITLLIEEQDLIN